MFVSEISLREVLSVGKEFLDIKGLSSVNLFVGRNGVGKTNILRVLGDLPIEYSHLGDTSGTHPRAPRWKIPSFQGKLKRSFVCRRVRQTEDLGSIVVRYTDNHEPEPNQSIGISSGLLTSGNVSSFKSRISMVQSDWGDPEFLKSITQENEAGFLSFCLQYIFQRKFTVDTNGFIDELHSEISGVPVGDRIGARWFNRDEWPGGVLRTAKIIQQLRGVCLIEEPEMGLEPRAVRRLINLLGWLTEADADEEAIQEIEAL